MRRRGWALLGTGAVLAFAAQSLPWDRDLVHTLADSWVLVICVPRPGPSMAGPLALTPVPCGSLFPQPDVLDQLE